jgi:2-oxoglutarate ferredoxin oxidoreductase subunit gamma
MTERIICAGFGGQGIMAMGKILAMSALREGKKATWLPSYGAEVRGGTAHCVVVISDDPIASPMAQKADTLIIMNDPSLKRFRTALRSKGLLLVNATLAQCLGTSRRLRVVNAPLTQMARDLGLEKVANTAAIGVYLGLKKIIALTTMEQSIEEVLAHRPNLIDINKKALEEGYFWAKRLNK